MEKVKTKTVRNKRIKNQFVLVIGDEGAILTHYHKGKLENRLFVESPSALDVGLIEKLFVAYPKSPISLLVDVLEQNYSQQVFPPVSPLAVREQVMKRIRRDFQPQDFNGYISMGRSTEGRKDWNFLFISLANSPPFSDWLALVLKQKNHFHGVYLLPIEAQKLTHDLRLAVGQKKQSEWEIAIFHNKTGGFRITAFKKGKIIFTRMAQQLIGDNIPEVVVGSLEQEVLNTIEYLKRLGFRGEADSKIVLITGQDIIEKIDKTAWSFGLTELYTPIQAAKLLGLSRAVYENDKFADIVCASFFASRKPVLHFDSSATKNLTLIYRAIKMVYMFMVIVFLTFLFLGGGEILNIFSLYDKQTDSEIALRRSTVDLSNFKKAERLLPTDYRRRIDIMQISRIVPKQKSVVEEKITQFGSYVINYKSPDGAQDSYLIKEVKFKIEKNDKQDIKDAKFTMEISLDMETLLTEQDFASLHAGNFEGAMKKDFKGYDINFSQKPAAAASADKDKVVVDKPIDPKEKIKLPGVITIKGPLYEKKKNGQASPLPGQINDPNQSFFPGSNLTGAGL